MKKDFPRELAIICRMVARSVSWPVICHWQFLSLTRSIFRILFLSLGGHSDGCLGRSWSSLSGKRREVAETPLWASACKPEIFGCLQSRPCDCSSEVISSMLVSDPWRPHGAIQGPTCGNCARSSSYRWHGQGFSQLLAATAPWS